MKISRQAPSYEYQIQRIMERTGCTREQAERSWKAAGEFIRELHQKCIEERAERGGRDRW